MPRSPVLRARDDRLDALNQLASKLVHDFNNFLAPILGYVTMIKEDTEPNSPVRHYVAVMETAACQTTGSLEQVLSAVRPQRRFRKRPTDLALLIHEELLQWEATLTRTARITVKSRLDPCQVVVDPDHWRRVIQQLLKNGHYALGTGGTLNISLHDMLIDRERATDLGLATERVFQLIIQDDGFGMSEETLDRAFDPYFTTRPKGSALGLGLTLVHNVVRLHHGQIVLESREDKGTTVTVWLPAEAEASSPEDTNRLPEIPIKTAPVRREGRSILVVDDDAMVREVIKTALQRANLTVLTAHNGKEGLAVFRKHAKELGLIISDVAMPVLGGFEMLREIRQAGSTLPVIFISGETATIPSWFQSSGADDDPVLIKKPFALKGFVETVRNRLG